MRSAFSVSTENKSREPWRAKVTRRSDTPSASPSPSGASTNAWAPLRNGSLVRPANRGSLVRYAEQLHQRSRRSLPRCLRSPWPGSMSHHPVTPARCTRKDPSHLPIPHLLSEKERSTVGGQHL